ncbi:hypothetical protein D1115_19265 [Vibrio alfacsensis]|uniref:Uncharacterized protein n=1 Tax=Vibrio alfacsensis TaxID=1074311 RepID=A0ABN5PLT0_9VIBR|nr:hypothetical protein [Vibrio alfacsensis]AXY03069.1 hypothetical protein D1115_19265 [Vibrio alfacsensis]
MSKHEIQVRQKTDIVLAKSSKLMGLTNKILANRKSVAVAIKQGIWEKYPEMFEAMMFMENHDILGHYVAMQKNDWLIDLFHKVGDIEEVTKGDTYHYFPLSMTTFSENKMVVENRDLLWEHWDKLSPYHALRKGAKVDKEMFYRLLDDGEPVFEDYYLDLMEFDWDLQTLLKYKDRFSYKTYGSVYYAFEWSVEFYEAVKHKDANIIKYLSENGILSYELMEHLKHDLDWEAVSKNTKMEWTPQMINAFGHLIDADGINEARERHMYYEPVREYISKPMYKGTHYAHKFKEIPMPWELVDWEAVTQNPERWSWKALSMNCTFKWSSQIESLFDTYGNWHFLSSNSQVPWNEPNFMRKFSHKLDRNQLSQSESFKWTNEYILAHLDKEESSSLFGDSKYLCCFELTKNKAITSNKELFDIAYSMYDEKDSGADGLLWGIFTSGGYEGLAKWLDPNNKHSCRQRAAKMFAEMYPMTDLTLEDALETFQEIYKRS